MRERPPRLVLAVHPTSRGFGWVLFESTSSPVDWGTASAKKSRNSTLERRFERLLRRYEPFALVLEAFEGWGTARSPRIQELCRRMIWHAAKRGMTTAVYGRDRVAAVLGLASSATRHACAEAVAQRLDAFAHRLPAKRKPWVAEDPRQSLFDAAALGLTAYATGE